MSIKISPSLGLRVPEILDPKGSGLRVQDFGCLQNPAREETAAGLALEACVLGRHGGLDRAVVSQDRKVVGKDRAVVGKDRASVDKIGRR